MLRSAIVFCTTLCFSKSTFTDDFNSFLLRSYGEELQKSLERIDMGPGMIGSFGGKINPDDKLKRRPVIFVHGALFTAGLFIPHYDFFLNHDYTPQELYATTFDDALSTPLLDVPVTCSEFKQIRNFIEAVHDYTNSKVDIIAYSLGVLISRKAILGGKCFDTEEQLGSNLTHMSELNSQPYRYEGNFSYSIFSFDDDILGVHCCNHKCAELRNAVFSIGFPNLDHLTILSATKFLQRACLDHPQLDDVLNSAPLFIDGTKISVDH